MTPTQPGFYWVKSRPDDDWTIVEIFNVRGELRAGFAGDDSNAYEDFDSQTVWGPKLEPPKDQKTRMQDGKEAQKIGV
jgi:hypothetical protein